MTLLTPQRVTRAVAAVIVLVTIGYVGEPAAYWLTAVPPPSPGQIVLAGLGVAAFLATAFRVVGETLTYGAGGDRRLLDLAICGSAAFAMPLCFGPLWLALPALLAGFAAITLAPRRTLVAVPLLLTGQALVGGAELAPLGGLDLVDLILRTALTAIIVGALGWLGHFAEEVFRGRAELAQLAVVEERLRFARDLHDVLGHALSVIGLKNEVALRLLERDPRRAATEIESARQLAADSVRDLRSLVRGYRNPTLADEVAGVCSILELAGIRCDADAAPVGLPQDVQEVSGWIVREAGTNILRHAKATTCTIKLRVSGGDLLVEIVNDGAGSLRASGSGLTGLAERVAAVDGEFSAESSLGRFTLRANLPLTKGART
ncbi:hypothetical protein Ssi03_48790 [Sphaerisporangium siamense]|uniref:Two-component system sensor histidine kinase DesK n=1 Tax=Sphaerisporangium siamense TaxID=795645 RepID=A0A7W7GA02_9ACTN|nr:histidine kinase [Sphaerisporangium siamense]MBB4699476.1 two-component system sensor histidine kinase DesK [Sphaerisporangium siamense]GII86889.1 hypothetical protein Ssi03_48790 [Sphaerisporangium siamense]